MLTVDVPHELTVRGHKVVWHLADSDAHFFRALITAPDGRTWRGRFSHQCSLELDDGEKPLDGVLEADIESALWGEVDRVASIPYPAAVHPMPAPSTHLASRKAEPGTAYARFKAWMEPLQKAYRHNRDHRRDHRDYLFYGEDVLPLFKAASEDRDLLRINQDDPVALAVNVAHILKIVTKLREQGVDIPDLGEPPTT